MNIKICGIKNKETLLCCENNNVNFFGMIFYDKSPRNICIQDAKILQDLSRNLKINGVGVFVNKDLKDIKNYIKDLKLDFIQLHGEENNEYIKNIKKLKIKVIKKISIEKNDDLKLLSKYEDADFFLFDYKPLKGELPGGNAKSFDWKIIKGLEISKPWFLSGGINFNNIHLIKSEINPHGVDLSSGVEKELGIKDNHIINKFIGKLKNA